MEQLKSGKSVVRQFAIITVIGFLVVTLAGPALAIIGTLLPFALVGGAVWLVYKGFTMGPKFVFSTIGKVVGGSVAVLLFLPKLVFRGARRLGGFTFNSAKAVAFFTGSIAIPMVVGSLIGGALGAMGGMEHHDMELRVPVGVAMGAGIGLLTVLVRTRPASRQVASVPTVLPLPQA